MIIELEIDDGVIKKLKYHSYISSLNKNQSISCDDIIRIAVNHYLTELNKSPSPKTDRAMEWLYQTLYDNWGEMYSAEIKRLAVKQGITSKPLREARERLNIEIFRNSKGQSIWKLF